MRGILAGILALAVLVGGCVGSAADPLLGCPPLEAQLFAPPALDDGGLSRAAGEPLPLVVWSANELDAELRFMIDVDAPAVGLDPLDPDEPAVPVVQRVAPGERAFAILQIAPAANGTVSVTIDAEAVGDAGALACDAGGTVTRSLVLENPAPANRAAPGEGALVRTVGWWTNGTSFYTNLDRYHARALPTGYLGEYGGDEPLPVYVYNESGDEMPQRYEDAGYVTTIPGFNEALKGHPTTGARVAYLDPSEAYTREGATGHALYGDPLIFYVEVLALERVPCEVPEPVCTPPDGDDVPRLLDPDVSWVPRSA